MHNKRFFLKYNLHHLLFWMLIYGLWYYFRYQDYRTEEIAAKITFIKVADLAVAVYITNLLLIPKLLYKKKYVYAVAAFILLLFASSILKVYLMGQVISQPDLLSLSGNLKTRLYENLISDFFLVLTGASFKLIFDYTKMQQRLTEVAKEKAETELNFLKSQINPHFLFNSLNSVYFLINKENQEARDALVKFSDMLRYQLYEGMGTLIPIEKEISYLRDYVDLQKLRKNESYLVEFNHSPDVGGFSIEPLLLIPFVENAFKHLSHYNDKKNFVRIGMERSNGTFNFSVENSRNPNQKTTEQQGGIGLNNVKRRLELLYPGKYQLAINESADKYFINLNLNIEN